MKVAVYGVAKNEEYNIKTWYESSKDADYHLILDTGSTDNTVKLAESFGINVISASFIPWDETLAKNVALSLLPSDIDYCIMLDLDQKIKTENWKNILISNSVVDYDVVESDLLDNIDGINNNLNISKIRSIHNRKNSYWDKYRPRIRFYTKKESVIFLNIIIENIAGNEERFLEREITYEKAFEREYNRLNKDNVHEKNIYMLEIIAHQAFNFYERNMFDKYLLKYIEFMDIYSKLPDVYKPYCLTLYSTFLYAHSAYYTEDAEKILSMIPDESNLKPNANFKIETIKKWSQREYSKDLDQYSNTQLIDLYADTKTGRHKNDLAKKAYNYYLKTV